MGGRTEKSVRQAYCIAIVAFVMLAGVGEARAVLGPVNSNSVVQDGIEFYMQTNKTVYGLGEDVEMSYRVINLREENTKFVFGNPLMHDFGVVDIPTGKEIWRLTYIDGSWTARVGSSFTLGPGETQEFDRVWNQTTDAGTTNLRDDVPVGIGDYDLSGMLFYGYTHDGRSDGPYYVPVSVSITIIPEPATLALLGTGMIGLLTCGRTKQS